MASLGDRVAAFKVNLKFEQGATFLKRFTWYTGTPAAKVAVDLTGCTARMQIRPSHASSVVYLELTTENDRILLGGAAGTIELSVGFEDTTALTFDKGVFDLEIVLADATVRRLVRGTVRNSKEVTR